METGFTKVNRLPKTVVLMLGIFFGTNSNFWFMVSEVGNVKSPISLVQAYYTTLSGGGGSLFYTRAGPGWLKWIVLGACSVYFMHTVKAQIDENNITTTKIEEQTVEEQTIPPPQTAADPMIDRSSHYHHHVEPTYHGFWKKKFIWRPRWVKTWQEKKIYVAKWKRMWGPAQLKEWVPVPQPPPGWLKHSVGRAHGTLYVKTHPH